MTYGYQAQIKMDSDVNAETMRAAVQSDLDTKTKTGSPYVSAVMICRSSDDKPVVIISVHLTTESERNTFQTEVVSEKDAMIANVLAFIETTYSEVN